MEDAISFVEFAQTLADLAAQETLARFRTPQTIHNKDAKGFDPVTQADRAAEQAMRTAIEQTYPDHGILGEEYGEKKASGKHSKHSGKQWVLDPIDGTRAFITGMPIWGTLIALNDNGKPVIGVFDQPFTGERMISVAGQRTIFKQNGTEKIVQTRTCANLADAIGATTDHRFFLNAAGEAEMQILLEKIKLMRYGGDSYNYAMLACGHIDVVIEQNLQPHDIQALIPIIEGAGGIVTDWQGGAATQGGQIIACGDKTLHAHMLEIFAPAAQHGKYSI